MLDILRFERSWDLDDIVVRSGGDGRTVEAYAAVFDTPQEIRDKHGHYIEEIDPKSFNRTLSHGIERVGVYYHHGMTIHGTPSGIGSVPIGRSLEVRPDKRGLLTVTRYNKSELAEATLEAIRNGDIRGYSFSGRIIRSSPARPPRPSGGRPGIWRHFELGLAEYGPTPNPAYANAGILAMRSQLADVLDEARRLIDDFTPTTPEGDPDGETPTPTTGPGAEDSPKRHSGRRQEQLRLRAELRAKGVL